MKRNGFTLIELLIVMALIGLLATIAIPRLTNTKERAQLAAMKSDLRNLVTMEENYLAENQKYTIDLSTAYHVSPGNRTPTIALTTDGWTASITSPRRAKARRRARRVRGALRRCPSGPVSMAASAASSPDTCCGAPAGLPGGTGAPSWPTRTLASTVRS